MKFCTSLYLISDKNGIIVITVISEYCWQTFGFFYLCPENTSNLFSYLLKHLLCNLFVMQLIMIILPLSAKDIDF